MNDFLDVFTFTVQIFKIEAKIWSLTQSWKRLVQKRKENLNAFCILNCILKSRLKNQAGNQWATSMNKQEMENLFELEKNWCQSSTRNLVQHEKCGLNFINYFSDNFLPLLLLLEKRHFQAFSKVFVGFFHSLSFSFSEFSQHYKNLFSLVIFLYIFWKCCKVSCYRRHILLNLHLFDSC